MVNSSRRTKPLQSHAKPKHLFLYQELCWKKGKHKQWRVKTSLREVMRSGEQEDDFWHTKTTRGRRIHRRMWTIREKRPSLNAVVNQFIIYWILWCVKKDIGNGWSYSIFQSVSENKTSLVSVCHGEHWTCSISKTWFKIITGDQGLNWVSIAPNLQPLLYYSLRLAPTNFGWKLKRRLGQKVTIVTKDLTIA